jgi:hypothetical protein
MNPIAVPMLATVFKVAGAALGLPSLAVLVLYAVHTLKQRLAAAPAETDFGDNPDAVLWVLNGMTQVIGTAANIAGSIAQIVFDIAAFGAGAGLVLAIACWFTGRGLHADATWARVSASVLLTVVMLVALLFALSVRGIGRLPLFGLVMLGALGLHALWFGARPAGA